MFFYRDFLVSLPVEMQKALPLVPSLQSNWLMMHGSMMMVSYATLILGHYYLFLYLAFFNNTETKNFENNNGEAVLTSNVSASKSSLLETVDI
jgi:ABC-type transport system involved in cytochrome c biogenesis permease subunit